MTKRYRILSEATAEGKRLEGDGCCGRIQDG